MVFVFFLFYLAREEEEDAKGEEEEERARQVRVVHDVVVQRLRPVTVSVVGRAWTHMSFM
jgi:hypothetical protein